MLLNPLEAEAGFAQRMADGGDVGRSAGFYRDIDDGFAQAHPIISAVVNGFDDVSAFAGENLSKLQQRAGAILQIDADT